MVLQPNLGLGHLIVDVIRSHTIRHTLGRIPPCKSDQPITEAATYTTHNKHNVRKFMTSAGVETAVAVIKRPTETFPVSTLNSLRTANFLPTGNFALVN